VAIYSGIGGAAMVSSSMPGFPPRGGTLYVFSIDGESPHGGAGQMQTEGGAPAARQDHGMGGKP
jgi:alcohol dehydrogenase (cytochrome c)